MTREMVKALEALKALEEKYGTGETYFGMNLYSTRTMRGLVKAGLVEKGPPVDGLPTYRTVKA